MVTLTVTDRKDEEPFHLLNRGIKKRGFGHQTEASSDKGLLLKGRQNRGDLQRPGDAAQR